MHNDWSLAEVFDGLHKDVQHVLQNIRSTVSNSVTKGDASESAWLRLLKAYLPHRYSVARAFVVDSESQCSDQIDIVIFDRQYTPFIFNYEGAQLIPAESIYAVFEVKQSITADYIGYAREKATSVRSLHRTSLPIPHAGGTYPPKPLIPILGGILATDSDWEPPLGEPLLNALGDGKSSDRLDFGCIAAHGCFKFDEDAEAYGVYGNKKPAATFLLDLIGQLQLSATVPMIDIKAYAKWLNV